MPSPSTHEKHKLSHPLFCAEFLDKDTLLVAGGGGENRGGIPNAITILNVSDKIKELSSYDMSRTEDAVMSLAVVPSPEDDDEDEAAAGNEKRPRRARVRRLIAGVNENVEAVTRTNSNRHFRSFTLNSSADNERHEVSAGPSAQLFRPKNWADIYQRTAVCSKSGRVGVVVSTGSKDKDPFASELVAVKLDSSNSTPEVLARIRSSEEITDASVVPVHINVESFDEDDEDDDYSDAEEWIAYSTSKSVFLRKLKADLPASETANEEGDTSIYTIPSSSGSNIRAIKLITPALCLVLINLTNRGGAELILLSFPTGKKPSVISRHQLHKTIKAATALSALSLAKKQVSITSSSHSHQTLIAVAGADCSVSVVVLDLQHSSSPANPHAHLSGVSWHLHRTYNNEHAFPATSVSFSPAPLPEDPMSFHAEPAHKVRLASVSAANTLSVHTLALNDAHSLSSRSKFSVTVIAILSSLIFIVFLALMLQMVFEYRHNRKGGMKERLEGLVSDMKGVAAGVKDGVSREMLAGMFEGIFAAGG